MPLSLLRRIAFEGELTGLIQNPPSVLLPPFPATGLHLQFDAWFLARITELVFEGGLRVQHDVRPGRIPELLLQTKRDERRRACWYALGNFGTGPDYSFEVLTDWERRRLEMGYPKGAKPVVVIIDYKPDLQRTLLEGLPREYNRYPIRYRPSPAAEAHLGPGSRIGDGSPNFGTLGGFLQDNVTQDLFAVTCAHVAGASNPRVGEVDEHGKLLNTMGTVASSTLPPTVGPCNMHAHPGAGVDAALIKITQVAQLALPSSISVGPIVDVDQDDLVQFHGSRSGRVNARVAAATIWKWVKIGGQDHCFGDLFALGHRHPGYVLQAVSQHTDSGAWIFDDGGAASTKWLGMIIGGDKQQNQSLACYGEHILTWARSVRPNLVLPP